MAPDPLLMAGVLSARTRVRRREHWNRDQLLTYQRRRLDRLVNHAISRSAYYRERVGPLRGASLAELPVLTKDTLMNEWDRVCTEPSLSLDSVERQLRSIEESGGDPAHGWRGRWWLAATGGTTGRRASLAWDRREWAQVRASYARVNDWAEVDLDLRHPVRTAIVSSLNPTHQSAVVGASLRSHIVPALRLDARAPMPDLVAELNAFEPRLLVAFASMVGPLAVAQLEGRLRIAPEKIVAASEALSDAARAAAQAAWGQHVVIDSYAATETASIASTCAHGGWHLYEDFVIAEPVDDEYRPVPVGQAGTRLLVTPLFTRTLPLIRYELTDSVRSPHASAHAGDRSPSSAPLRAVPRTPWSWSAPLARFGCTRSCSIRHWSQLPPAAGRSSSSPTDFWCVSSAPRRLPTLPGPGS